MPVFQRMPGMKTWNGFAMVVGRRAAGALLTAFIAGWVFFTFHAPATDWLDRFLRDSAQAVGMRFREATPNLAIVCIDAETLETVPGRWPWPRAEFARLLRKLGEGKPRFIVFDILLQHLDGEKPSAGDEDLAATMRNLGNVALVSNVEQSLTPLGLQIRHFRNHSFFREAAQIEGFVWGVIDPDNQIRSFILRDSRLGLESCVSQVAHRVKPDVRLWEGLSGDVVQCPIAFARNGGGIPSMSAGDLLKGEIPTGLLRDRIVLVGVTAPILHDFHRTVLGIVSGVDVLASELDTLVSGRGGFIEGNMSIRLGVSLLGLLLGAISMAWEGWLAAIGSVGCLSLVLLTLLAVGETLFLHFPVAPLAVSWGYSSIAVLGLRGFLEFLRSQFASVEGKAAALVQQQIFPLEEWSSAAGYRCRGFCLPCDETGGDYFDFIPLSNGSLFFLIGDVSGHGFSAAMITTMAKTVTQILAQEGRLTPEVAHETFAKAFSHLLRRKRMMTMLLGHLDVKSHEISLAFAGHLPPLLIRKDGQFNEISCPSIPFGFSEKPPLLMKKFFFPPGASFVLYTDGITEALNWDDEIFTFPRWYESLSKAVPKLAPGSDPAELLSDLLAFTDGRPFADDVTILLLQRRG